MARKSLGPRRRRSWSTRLRRRLQLSLPASAMETAKPGWKKALNGSKSICPREQAKVKERDGVVCDLPNETFFRRLLGRVPDAPGSVG